MSEHRLVAVARSQTEAYSLALVLSSDSRLRERSILTLEAGVSPWPRTVSLLQRVGIPTATDDGSQQSARTPLLLTASTTLMRRAIETHGMGPRQVAAVSHGALSPIPGAPFQDWVLPAPAVEMGGLFAPQSVCSLLRSSGWSFRAYRDSPFPISCAATQLKPPGPDPRLLVLTQHVDIEYQLTMVTASAQAARRTGLRVTVRLHPRMSDLDAKLVADHAQHLNMRVTDGALVDPLDDLEDAGFVIAHWSTGLFEARAAGRITAAFVGNGRSNHLSWPTVVGSESEIADLIAIRPPDLPADAEGVDALGVMAEAVADYLVDSSSP